VAKKINTAGKSGGENSVNKWILPGQKQQGSGAWGASEKKSVVKGKGGSVFSAMMMDDSSSDED
jgi:hypothetical protein